MPSTCHHSHDLNVKLKIIGKDKAVNNNHEIAHEYGIATSNMSCFLLSTYAMSVCLLFYGSILVF